MSTIGLLREVDLTEERHAGKMAVQRREARTAKIGAGKLGLSSPRGRVAFASVRSACVKTQKSGRTCHQGSRPHESQRELKHQGSTQGCGAKRDWCTCRSPLIFKWLMSGNWRPSTLQCSHSAVKQGLQVVSRCGAQSASVEFQTEGTARFFA